MGYLLKISKEHMNLSRKEKEKNTFLWVGKLFIIRQFWIITVYRETKMVRSHGHTTVQHLKPKKQYTARKPYNLLSFGSFQFLFLQRLLVTEILISVRVKEININLTFIVEIEKRHQKET